MNMDKNNLHRRTLLLSGAGGAATSLLAGQSLAMGTQIESKTMDVYQALGVRKLINAAGTITALGGSLMPPEVLAAWNAAATSFVNLAELQDRVGERIASLIGVEAALVTT